ncbi:AEC family transporter [Kiritimatiellota bacterium B12222]|nr:AEC family transporter [Kiritimatiellota bacterium B12222]
MLLTLLTILVPVFGLILLGGWLRVRGFLDEPMEKAFNKFCYYIALPLFIFLKSAQSPTLNAEALKTAGALTLVTLGLLICGSVCVKVIRLPQRSAGTFTQATFRGNLAYIGLPVIAFAVSDRSAGIQAQAESLAILSMAPGVFVYNLLGVMVLEWDRRHERQGHPLLSCVESTLKNPLIIACVLGFTWNALSWSLPVLFIKTMTPITQTAFPLALLAIGARIAVLNWKQGLGPALAVSVVKNGGGLLLGYVFCQLLGLEGLNRLVILVLSTCPTAIASYVLVDQLDGDRDLAASSIAVTHLGSILALSAALWIGLSL